MYYNNTDLIQLTPAYDLISTRLLISKKDDPEESALTINGKKTKLLRSDFDSFAKNIGLNDKQLFNVYQRIKNHIPQALEFIDMSFLSLNKKVEFKNLIIERVNRLLL